MKLRFTDKQIERPNIPEQEFSYVDKNGISKFRVRLTISFDLTKQSVLKRINRLNYWF